MAKKEEQIFIGIGEEVIELTGTDKDAFLEQRAKDQAELAAIKAEADARAAARESAISKLSALGLSEDEIRALVGA